MAETSVTKVIADILNNPLEGGAKKHRNPDIKIKDGVKISGGIDLSAGNDLISASFAGGISLDQIAPAGSGGSCGLRGGAELTPAAAGTAAAAEAVVDAGVPPVEGGKRKLHPKMILFNEFKNKHVKELKRMHPEWNGAQVQMKAMKMAQRDYYESQGSPKMKKRSRRSRRSLRMRGGDSE